MTLLAALVLLASASDNFDTLEPEWRAGLRGLPQMELATIDGDSCLALRATTVEPTPGVDDLVRTFPRPVLASERPFAQAHIWLPPFEQWPTTNQNYAGFRLTITREQGGFVWPGIWLARVDGTPSFGVRILGDHLGKAIATPGWWTLGIQGDASGRLVFYAGAGRSSLTEADRFFTDPDPWTTVASFDGFFLQTATTMPFYVGDPQPYADAPPLTT